jgi:hypothetical protein
MAAPKQGSMSGADVLPKYNWDLGVNEDVMDSDRGGWVTSVEMLTGGQAYDWYCFGGLEVGNQYDMDPMGEERTETTFNSSDDGPQALGHVGMMAAGGGAGKQAGAVATDVGGKTRREEPQTYTRYGKRG